MSAHYEINGRKVTWQQFQRHMERQLRQVTDEAIKAMVQEIRCPDHGKRPTIRQTSAGGDGSRFQIEGCCQAVIEEAQTALAGS